MGSLKISAYSGGLSFKVKVIPSSSTNQVVGVYDGMLKVKISAAAEKGKANQQLVEFLSKVLQISKKDTTITSGATRRVKTVKVSGLTCEQVMGKLSEFV